MSAADVEALRDYADALNDFISFTTKAVQARKRIWGNPNSTDRVDALLQAIRDRRQAALVAGVQAGTVWLATPHSRVACSA